MSGKMVCIYAVEFIICPMESVKSYKDYVEMYGLTYLYKVFHCHCIYAIRGWKPVGFQYTAYNMILYKSLHNLILWSLISPNPTP